jgi:SAM-dependent methyltransferase
MNRDPVRPLLTTAQLERSGVVANCRMNRERTLTGGNGYTRELGFNPLEFVVKAADAKEQVRWLDLCCGTGGALIEAARAIDDRNLTQRVEIVGVDLVGLFAPIADQQLSLQLIEASLSTWTPDRPFDLITCVHGLHYIGDKLGLLARALSWLTEDGLFAANLSLKNIKLADSRDAARLVGAELRRQEVSYDQRRKRVTRSGRVELKLPFQFLGADDEPGPNYTGQAAVDSYYGY